MTLTWIAILIGAAAVVFAVAGTRRKQRPGGEFGSMSDEWVAEQRSNEPYYPGR